MSADYRLTIRDVADRAGVSVSTVSKVINERHGVARATYERVRTVIDETGYQASLVAQSLRNHHTNVIGILVSDIEPFSAELLKGAADAIRGSGFDLVIYSGGGRAEEHPGWERRYLSRLSGTLIDGAVVVTPTTLDVTYSAPVVAVDPLTGTNDLPTVASDNFHGGQLAGEHLISLGHRRIGMLTGRPDLQSARLREAGFRKAMSAAALPVDERLMCEADYERAASLPAAHAMLELAQPPTALFAANDVSALVAMKVAKEIGVRIPEDLSIVGFDNVPEASQSEPGLTTIEQPIHLMGYQAVDLLIRLIRGEAVTDRQVILPTRLIERASTRRYEGDQ